ncbi:S1 RNA-binding domain-containing protein [Natronincola ferrireducens]|uniref:S1 RNA binding domain protein n=1 Tax=Natronincola ferrireducens TaxID=393762 RepID=A0A1G8X021_9FIRM|nr:S1 RNA-binding domain-containing protein [Natronincola ferrireducens]SDJ83863.1 S1 RNA binding domain protein [Natronincola ferrireducens]
MLAEEGKIVEGTVSGITNFGAFIDLGEGKTGLVHISEVADDYVKNIHDYLKDKQKVKVKVLSIGKDGKISLSIRQATTKVKKSVRPAEVDWQVKDDESSRLSFDDKISRFMKESEEKMQVLKAKSKSNGRKGNGFRNKM